MPLLRSCGKQSSKESLKALANSLPFSDVFQYNHSCPVADGVAALKCSSIAASTPAGKNWFYDLFQKGISNEYPDYISIQTDSYNNPLISTKEVEEARKSLPDHIFKQEYLAEFVDDGGTVFQDIDRYCVLEEYPQPIGRTYCGIDLGRAQDYTVVTVYDEQGRIVHIYRDRQKTWDIIVSNIVKVLRQYKPTVFVEVNSIGDVVYEMIKKQYPNTFPFQTNTHSKQNMIEDLIIALNNGELQLPSKTLNIDLYNELQTFTYVYNPNTRNVKYEGKKGFHDDIIMSLGIGYYALKQKKSRGTYAFR